LQYLESSLALSCGEVSASAAYCWVFLTGSELLTVMALNGAAFLTKAGGVAIALFLALNA